MQGCLYTTVVNLGPERAYSFLGKHGKRLASGEQFSQPGNLADQLASHPRKFAAFERALTDGSLGVMQTPAVHVYDAELEETQVLGVESGNVILDNPCWGSLESVDEL